MNGFLAHFTLAIVEFGRNAAIAEDEDAVAQPDHFRHFRRNHDHAHSALGQFAEAGMDQGLRADVDAACRLVEN